MDKRICKDCKYYLKASDGKINHEVCLKTENKETSKCLYLAIRDIGIAISKALSR